MTFFQQSVSLKDNFPLLKDLNISGLQRMFRTEKSICYSLFCTIAFQEETSVFFWVFEWRCVSQLQTRPSWGYVRISLDETILKYLALLWNILGLKENVGSEEETSWALGFPLNFPYEMRVLVFKKTYGCSSNLSKIQGGWDTPLLIL